jgi:hypothetical protein
MLLSISLTILHFPLVEWKQEPALSAMGCIAASSGPPVDLNQETFSLTLVSFDVGPVGAMG